MDRIEELVFSREWTKDLQLAERDFTHLSKSYDCDRIFNQIQALMGSIA